MCKKTLNAPVKNSDLVHIEEYARERGRPKSTWVELLRKNIETCGL